MARTFINYCLVTIVTIIPLYLYGVNEGYSDITENSPWGIVTTDNDNPCNPNEPVQWRETYCPDLDSMENCGLS